MKRSNFYILLCAFTFKIFLFSIHYSEIHKSEFADSKRYFQGADKVYEVFSNNFLDGLTLIFINPNDYNKDLYNKIDNTWLRYSHSPGFVSRVAGVFSILTFNSFFIIS